MSKHRVLIIEDDRSLSDVLSYNLEESGYSVAVAHDGQDGLNRAQHQPPDIILLDLMLPVVDGLEVCRRLRANPTMDEVLIVMLTARAEESVQPVPWVFRVGTRSPSSQRMPSDVAQRSGLSGPSK